MATHTVYGCYNANTGVIAFDDTFCSAQKPDNGCYVATGANAGKIRIYWSDAYCSDTLYACYDKDTGKFGIEVSDSCCGIIAGTCCGGTKIAKYVSLYFTGIVDNGDVFHDGLSGCCCSDALNGNTFILENFSPLHNRICSYSELSYCGTHFTSDRYIWLSFQILGGGGTQGCTVNIKACSNMIGSPRLNPCVYECFDHHDIFNSDYESLPPDSDCCHGYPRVFDNLEGGGGHVCYHGMGGTVTVDFV